MSFYRGKRATKTKTTSSKYRVSGCGRMDDLRKSIVTPDDFHAPPRTLYSGAHIQARVDVHTLIMHVLIIVGARAASSNYRGKHNWRGAKTLESSRFPSCASRDPLIASIKKHATAFYSLNDLPTDQPVKSPKKRQGKKGREKKEGTKNYWKKRRGPITTARACN